MESLLAALGVVVVALLIAGALWLGGADITGAIILKYTLEPFVRWFMRVFLGVDRPLVGPEALVGLNARVISAFGPAAADGGLFLGRVEVRSESWSARSSEPIPEGSTVRVVSCQGVFLNVERSGV